MKQAEKSAEKFLEKHKFNRENAIFFFSGFYLGEGMKNDKTLMFANANPKILKAFLKLLRSIQGFKEEKIGIKLYLRADQLEKEMKKFWSECLHIPTQKFMKSNFDKRTIGKKTFNTYKGVCSIYYYDAKIQRFFLNLQNQYIQYLLDS
jgi:hypothetical protein